MTGNQTTADHYRQTPDNFRAKIEVIAAFVCCLLELSAVVSSAVV
jgi:hypothetical protein